MLEPGKPIAACCGAVLLVLAAASVLASCAVTSALPSGGSSAHPFFRELRPPLVIAHRGGTDLWPENTLHAFQRAMALGVDVLDMDLQATADGVVVVIHDPRVDRTTNGTGAVRARTLSELTKLDAGYRWSPDDGLTFPYRGRGLTVPTFAEVLSTLPGARVVAEIKPAAAAFGTEVCRVIQASMATDRVLVASMAARALDDFRRACPHVATSATPREVARFVGRTALRLPPLRSLRAVALQVPKRYRGVPVLTPRVLSAAHARNLQVHAWTINDERDMRRLLDLGVDGIVTDRPDRLLRVLGRSPRIAD